jgi:hypothetical protein
MTSQELLRTLQATRASITLAMSSPLTVDITVSELGNAAGCWMAGT